MYTGGPGRSIHLRIVSHYSPLRRRRVSMNRMSSPAESLQRNHTYLVSSHPMFTYVDTRVGQSAAEASRGGSARAEETERASHEVGTPLLPKGRVGGATRSRCSCRSYRSGSMCRT
jgi:hypothetical protein